MLQEKESDCYVIKYSTLTPASIRESMVKQFRQVSWLLPLPGCLPISYKADSGKNPGIKKSYSCASARELHTVPNDTERGAR